jgi:hypothetical protein
MSWSPLNLRRRAQQPFRRQPIRNKYRPLIELLENRLAPANVPILSGHYDGLLSGWNNQEAALNPTTVNDAGFGKLFNYQVDGYAYAQPLYVPNLTIPGPGGGTYNVVFAATEHDSVYAFNADAQTGGPNNDGVLWQRSFIDPNNGINTMPAADTFSSDIVPEVGITGTPVIDLANNTMFVIAKTKETPASDPGNDHFVQKLYAIDLTTGNNRASNGVVTIGDSAYVTGSNTFVSNTTNITVPGSGAGSQNGILAFDARKESNRMSDQLVNGTVYLAWASHGDNGPYHGWIVGYKASDLSLQKIYNTSPDGSASGIWESGGNLGFDSQGNLYFSSGNGFGTGNNAYRGGNTALGDGGGALGYSGGAGIIKNSVSVRFRNLPTNTGLGTNGNFGPDVAMPGFDFNAGAQANPSPTYTVTVSYNASTHTLSENIVNNSDPSQNFSTTYNIDIPGTIGGTTAYVGFTGGNGGLNSEQDIRTWTFTPTTGAQVNHGTGFANASDLTANGSASLPPYKAPSPVGAFQYHQDLGIPGDPVPGGTASFSGGTYTLTASGTDIGFKGNQYDTDTDRMQFVYNPVSYSSAGGNVGEIIARVKTLTGSMNPNDLTYWTKAVVQIRQSLDPQAANVESVVGPHNVSEITWRDNPPSIDDAGNQAPGLTGATERGAGTAPLPNVWIRLQRNGNTFTSWWAVDNNGAPGPWQGQQTHNTNMTGDVYVGIGLCSHSNGTVATATFDNVTMTGFTARTIDPVAILTPASNNQAGSIFSTNKVDVSGNWTTTFTFQMRAGSSTIADGLTFTVQNSAQGTAISESVLKLSTTAPGTALPVVDYFTPHDWNLLDGQDADLGSGGTMLLPDAVSGGKHLMIETGKTGRLYLIDRDNMGKFNTRYDHIAQIVTITPNFPNTTPGVWGNPAFLQDGPNTGLIYYWGSSAPGQAFRITDGVINPVAVSRSSFSMGFPGSQPSISSNGTDGSTAIMWALRDDNYGVSGPETLYAFSGENLTTPIWTSPDVKFRDELGGTSVKFTFPIVSNGHVYAAGNGSLAVYGLLPSNNVVPADPANLQVAQISPNQGGDTRLQLSWNTQTGATLFKVERSTTSGTAGFTQVAEVGGNQTTYTDTGLTALTHYWYRIRATNQKGDSVNYSNVGDNFTHLGGAQLILTSVASREVDLSWSSVLANNSGNHYNVEQSTDNFATFTTVGMNLPPTQTTFSDLTVSPGNTYQYRVHAFNVNPSPNDFSFSNVGVANDIPVDIEAPFPGGIMSTDAAGLQFNGSAIYSGTERLIRLTNDLIQAGSVFTNNRVDVGLFSTTFWVRLHEGTQPTPADGFTFTIQSNSPAALGGTNGALGYQGIGNSVAIKFDVFKNSGDPSSNCTGLFTNGQSPTGGTAIDPAIVNLSDQHRKRIDISYDALTLQLNVTITDEQHAGGPTSVSQTYTVDIPGIVGTGGAYVGFTGATGGFAPNTGALYSLQDITGWVFGPTAPAGVSNLRATVNGTGDVATLTWKDNAVGEDGYTVERSADNYHFDLLATLDPGATSYVDTTVATNAISFYRLQAFSAQGRSTFAKLQLTNGGAPVIIDHSDGFASHGDLQGNGNTAFIDPAPTAGTIGVFTAHQDVGTAGNPGTPGTATFDNSTAKYTLTASGSDIWNPDDHFQYLYKPMTGDGEIIARVSAENSTDYWTKAGVMIRADTTATSFNAFMFETADSHNEPAFQWRNSTDPNNGSNDFGGHPGNDVGNRPPVWLRLVRSGNLFSGYWAADINNGQSHGPWQDIAGNGTTRWTTVNIPMGASVLVGLGLTAHNNGTVATATFDHVNIVTAARLTDAVNNQDSSLFKTQRVPITGSFSTSWIMNMRPGSGSADGLTFTIQADAAGAGALGQGGGGLGYSTDQVGGPQGIHPSVMVKFDMYSQGSFNPRHSTTGLYINGESPNITSKQIDMTAATGLSFAQNHTFQVDLVYDGLTLAETVRDLVSGVTFNTTYTIAIRDTIGSDTAYVGFTGGTGGENAWIAVESWTATFNPLAAPIHLEIHYPTTTSGQPLPFTVSARTATGGNVDNYRGTVTFTSDDPSANLPDPYTFTAADHGTHTFAAVFYHVGTDTLSVGDNSPSPFSDNLPVTVNPKTFVLSDFPSSTTAGDEHTFTVTALDWFNNVAPDYRGKVRFSSDDPQAALPADYTFTAGDGGTHTFAATLKTAGTRSITVRDPLTPTHAGTESGITVNPAAPSSFVLAGFPSSTQAGVPHDLTVTVKDAYGNIVSGYTGTVHVSSNDPQDQPQDYTFDPNSDAGVHTFSVTLFTAGTRAITVADNAAGVQATESGIHVTPGVAVGFEIMVLGNAVAGQPVDVFVTAVDAYGNTGAIYTGTIHFSSSDNAATYANIDGTPLAGNDYTFTAGDNGTHVFKVTFRTTGFQFLRVEDKNNPNIFGEEDDILVS